jgi:hypothetical protein
VKIEQVSGEPQRIALRYTVESLCADPVYLVDAPRMPYLMPSEEADLLVEIWAAIPPWSRKQPVLTPLFELPDTRELPAGSAETLELTLAKPLGWSNHFSSAVEPIELPPAPARAVLVLGYGRAPLSPLLIDRAEKLLQWQCLVRSETFELPREQNHAAR